MGWASITNRITAVLIMVLAIGARLHGQQETSPIAERYRKRQLTANERAAESFFRRNLPPGWSFLIEKHAIILTRKAPAYVVLKPTEESRYLAKPALLTYAKNNGALTNCTIAFRSERHDDTAIVRQKVRLFKEIRRDTEAAYDRLRLKFLCGSQSVQHCAIGSGNAAEAAQEYLTTRRILTEKLEVTPLYRIGTLYLYPLKNQCVPEEHDWYMVNSQIPAGALMMPHEAREEIEILLRNIEQLKFWN